MTRTSFTKEKGRRLFFLCIFLAVIYVWSSVWTALEFFEGNQPSDILADFRRDLISQVRAGNCVQILEDCSYKSPYYNNAHAGKVLANALKGKDISFRFDERIETESGFYSFYIILVDEKRVARFAIGTDESYSFLKLPIYRIVSIEGLVNFDIAVQDPEGLFVADVSFSSLDPVDRAFKFPDFKQLAANDPEMITPEFYIYHLEGLFDTPDIYREESEVGDTEILSTVIKDGKVVAGSSVLRTAESDIYDTFVEIWEKYGLYLAGDLSWDGMKVNVMNSVPVYNKMETRGEELYEKQKSTEFINELATGSMRWTARLVSISMEGEMVLHLDKEDKTYHLDNTIYLYYCDDGVWRICEIIERGYGKEEHE